MDAIAFAIAMAQLYQTNEQTKNQIILSSILNCAWIPFGIRIIIINEEKINKPTPKRMCHFKPFTVIIFNIRENSNTEKKKQNTIVPTTIATPHQTNLKSLIEYAYIFC